MKLEVTPENTRLVLRRYAALRALTNEIKALETDTKLYLERAMQPGETLGATDNDGNRLLTVSMTKSKSEEALCVVDSVAFAQWLDSKGIEHEGKLQIVFPKEFVTDAALTKLTATHGGEMPDGVAVEVKVSAPTVRPTQSKAMRELTFRAVHEARQFVEATQIEAPETVEVEE